MHAGLSYEDLRKEKQFSEVGVDLQAWFINQMQGFEAGVLVSHNTAVDIQFLCAEYQRAGMRFPDGMEKGLDTLGVLKRFTSLAYRQVASEDCPEGHLTKTGKPSMGVKPCAIYALSKRDSPELLEDVCGEHHDADTRMVGVILFDEKQFDKRSLYHAVFKSKKRCFMPLSETWTAIEIKMKEPVIKFEPLPPGWLPCNVRYLVSCARSHCMNNTHTLSHPTFQLDDEEDPISTSAQALPDAVDEAREKTFKTPPNQRGEGQPSPTLREYLRNAATGCSVTAQLMMVLLFKFFSEIVLDAIAAFTNDKANEMVYKKKVKRSDGKFYYQVCACMSMCEPVYLTECVLALVQVYNQPVPDSFKAPRMKGWKFLSAGELMVWICITFKIGCLGRSRVAHYWSDVPGFGDETIRSKMTHNRCTCKRY